MELSRKQRQFRRKILTETEIRAFAKATKALLGPRLSDVIQGRQINFEDSLRYMSVGARLEEARTKRGVSPKEMAAELKVPRYRLESVEKGRLRELQPELLLRYVDHLGLKNWFGKWKKANAELSGRMGLTSNDGQKSAETAAALPMLGKSLVEKKIDAFLKKRLPPWAAAEVRLSYKFRGTSVTIYEHRAPWREGDAEWTTMSVAQLRYDAKSGQWALYCADRNSRWHEYTDVLPTKNIDGLLSEIDRDPTGIFWG